MELMEFSDAQQPEHPTEVIKHNSEVLACQDSEIRSVNFSIILTDVDGNPIDDDNMNMDENDAHTATESVMNSDLSRSLLASRDGIYYHHSLARQNGIASLVPTVSPDTTFTNHDHDLHMVLDDFDDNNYNGNTTNPNTNFFDYNHDDGDNSSNSNNPLHSSTLTAITAPTREGEKQEGELEYINIDCADDIFQESLGLFDWDLSPERSAPVFPLVPSPTSSSSLLLSSSQGTPTAVAAYGKNMKTTVRTTTTATASMAVADGLDSFEFNEEAVTMVDSRYLPDNNDIVAINSGMPRHHNYRKHSSEGGHEHHHEQPIVEANYFFSNKEGGKGDRSISSHRGDDTDTTQRDSHNINHHVAPNKTSGSKRNSKYSRKKRQKKEEEVKTQFNTKTQCSGGGGKTGNRASWRDTFIGLMFPSSNRGKDKNKVSSSSSSSTTSSSLTDDEIIAKYPTTLLQANRKSHGSIVPVKTVLSTSSLLPTQLLPVAPSPRPRMQDVSIADKRRVISAEEKLVTLVGMLRRMRKRLKRKNSNSSGRGKNSSVSSHNDDNDNNNNKDHGNAVNVLTMDSVNISKYHHNNNKKGGVTNIKTIAKNIIDQSTEEKLVQLVKLLRVKRERDRISEEKQMNDGNEINNELIMMDNIEGTVDCPKILDTSNSSSSSSSSRSTRMVPIPAAPCCIHDSKKRRSAVQTTLDFLKHVLLESPQSSSCTLQHCLLELAIPTCELRSTSISHILSAARRKRQRMGLHTRTSPPPLSVTDADANTIVSHQSCIDNNSNGQDGSSYQSHGVKRVVNEEGYRAVEAIVGEDDDMECYEYHGIGQLAACIRAFRTALIDLIPSNPTELVDFAKNTTFSVSMPTDRLIYNPAKNELSSSFILHSSDGGNQRQRECSGNNDNNDSDKKGKEISVFGLVKALFVKDLEGRYFVSTCRLNFDPNSILKHCSHNDMRI